MRYKLVLCLLSVIGMTGCLKSMDLPEPKQDFKIASDKSEVMVYDLKEKLPEVSLIFNGGDLPEVVCTSGTMMSTGAGMVYTPGTCNDGPAKVPYYFEEYFKQSGVFKDVKLMKSLNEQGEALRLHISYDNKQVDESATDLAGSFLKGAFIGATLGVIPTKHENVYIVSYQLEKDGKIYRKGEFEEADNFTISIYNIDDDSHTQEFFSRVVNKINAGLLASN